MYKEFKRWKNIRSLLSNDSLGSNILFEFMLDISNNFKVYKNDMRIYYTLGENSMFNYRYNYQGDDVYSMTPDIIYSEYFCRKFIECFHQQYKKYPNRELIYDFSIQFVNSIHNDLNLGRVSFSDI